MVRKVKKTKKGKTIVTQKVTVNIGKGGGKARRTTSGQPQPSQAERMVQLFAPLLAQRQSLVQTGQPLQSSQQQLQSLESILSKLIPKQGEKGEKGDKGEPAPIFNYDPSASIRTPSLASSESRSSLDSFAFDFSGLDQSGRSYVLDQPDSPLVRPSQPAVSGGAQRLDPPHEDVPLEAIGEGKQEEIRVELNPSEVPEMNNITLAYLQQAPNTATQKKDRVSLKQIAKQYNIPIPRIIRDEGKQAIVDYLWDAIQSRR
jgi:hypothetical protein